MSIVEVKHNITPDKVLFCYRKGDSESFDVAQYYASLRYLQPFQLCPLPVDNVQEIDYDTYLSSIEAPIFSWITDANKGDSAGHTEMPFVYCIILGYNIPNVLNYYGERISLASRVSRLGHPVEIKRPNHTFDRKTWKYFDDIDNGELYVTAVIDGPTKQDAINLIDRGRYISSQGKIGGKIVIDPYGNKQTENQIEYQQEILDFIQYDVDSFGSEWTTTIDIDDPYSDPTIAYLQDDSFYWGWFQNICNPQMFKDGKTPRVFCYNADNGPFYVKDVPIESGLWANVSLQVNNPGYASTAGPVDIPNSEDEYVFPRPFFYSLHQETGIGEAFLTSTKYVDWKMCFVGDPLSVVKFPLEFSDNVDQNLICKEIIYRTIRTAEDYINKVDRLNALVESCSNLFLNSPSFAKQYIFYENVKWKNRVDETEQHIAKLLVGLKQYHSSTTGEQFGTWLTENDIKVSTRFSEIFKKYTSSDIPSTIIRSNNDWELDFVYTHTELTLEKVFFILEFATDSGFTDIIKTIRMSDSIDGWHYEKEPYIFFPIELSGLSSNYAGRRVRYVSTIETELIHTGYLYYRVTVDDSGRRVITSGQKVI